jgi:DNA adenine methylase
MTPERPIIRYHGGKWLLAPWIIEHFPAHRVYVEPFGGAASVLLQKPRSYAEIYNDLDGELVNLFKAARDYGSELLRMLELTPFARAEFDLSYERSVDPVEQARRTIIRAYMGFGSTVTRATKQDVPMRTGFRCDSNRSGTTPAADWRNLPGAFPAIIERLQGVVIENRDARELMMARDREDTLHYVDPPYVPSTRTSGTSGTSGTKASGYRHEMTEKQHRSLAHVLKRLRGAVVLSGYDSELYRSAFADWTCFERHAHADGARDRTEVLWLNARASAALHPDLFGRAVAA